jgi:hypothetical protein
MTTGTVSSGNLTSLYSNTTSFTAGVVNSSVYSVNGGLGVTVNPITGNVVVSIGQDVSTTANVTFANVTATGNLSNNYYTLANALGTNGQVLTTNGAGVTSWTTPSTLGLVNSVSGSGAGISVSPTTGAVIVSNTGVTSIVAGSNISISGATGAVTITATGFGTGDVTGPASATDNAIVRFDQTTGKLIQNSVVTIADTTGDIVTPGDLAVNGGDITTNVGAGASASLYNSSAIGTINIGNAVVTEVNIGNTSSGRVFAKTPSFETQSNAIIGGDLAVNGGDITTTVTGQTSLFNTNTTEINIGNGASTAVRIGSAAGVVNIKSPSLVQNPDGGASTTFNLLNTITTDLNIGGVATAIIMGNNQTTGLTTNRNKFYSFGDITTAGDLITINSDKTDTDVYLNFGRVAPGNNAAIRWNKTTDSFEWSADSTTWYDFINATLTPTFYNGQILTYLNGEWINDNKVTTTDANERNVFAYRPLSPPAGVNTSLYLRKDYSDAAPGTAGVGTYADGAGVSLSFQVVSDTQAPPSGSAGQANAYANITGVYSSTVPTVSLRTSIDNGVTNTSVGDFTTANASIPGSLTVESRSDIDTAPLTTTATAQVPLITSTRNVMKAVVYIVQGTDVHTVEALVLRTGASTAMVTTYAEMYNTSSLATFAADTSGGAIRLLVTPANATSMLFTSVITSLT